MATSWSHPGWALWSAILPVVMLENPWSSQDFIRALKANSDPPVAGGSLKVEIAQHAWNNPSFYVPSKAEVIADWALTRLVKDKAKEIHLNPIFDVRYWELVACVVSSREDVLARDTRHSNTWLTPLLLRLSVGTVVVSFLTSFNDVEEGRRYEIAKLVASCFAILWPIAVQRMSTENLQECFGALLCAVSTAKADEGLLFIARSIASSYRNSLINSSNKKKLYQSFLQSHLKNWIISLVKIDAYDDKTVKNIVLDAGLDTLFNIDVLRQIHDPKNESPLLENLRKLLISDRDMVLGIVPDLFDHYVTATKRNRGALFSQGSQSQPGAALQEFHETVLRFFTTSLGLVHDSHQDLLSWKTRLCLLKTVNEQNIFDRRQIEAHMTFNQILELVIVALNDAWQENRGECTSLAVQCLSTIARIDYDLIMPFVSRVFPLFLQIPTPSEEHFAFLDILLNYHTKTRSMGSLVDSLLSSIISTTTIPKGPSEQYQLLFSSPVMHSFYLDRLSKALHIFLTESQCLSTVNAIFDLLKNQWEALGGDAHKEAGSGVTPRKKRNGADENNQEKLAVTYSLICRFASVVLSSLPVPSLSSGTLEEVQNLLEEGRSGFLHTSISKSAKYLKKHTGSDSWCTEVALAANLRLLYAFNVSRNPPLPPLHDEKLTKRVADLTLNEELLPELVVELYRNLLYNLSVGNPIDHDEMMGRLFQYLSNHFTPTDVRWSGLGHQLTKSEPGRAESALALTHMLIDRWLPIIDRLASSEHIENFLKVVLSIKIFPSRSSRHQMQPEDLLWELLHSAQFWELRNIRNVFLNLLDRKTAFLDPSSTKKPKSTSILEKVSIYRYLLFFPMEYFSRQLLNDLVKRAIAADLAITPLISSDDSETTDTLTVLRVFSKRAYIYCGSVARDSDKELSDFLLHLLQIKSNGMSLKADFTKATLDLVEIYLSKLLKSAQKDKTTSVLREALTVFTPSHLFVYPLTILTPSFILLVNLLEREFLADTLPDDFLNQLADIHNQTSSILLHKIKTYKVEKLSRQDIAIFYDLVSGWYSLLCLEKWLSSTEHKAPLLPLIGENITSTLLLYLKAEDQSQSDELDALCSDTFAVLLEELGSRPVSEHAQHLDVVVAMYISFCDMFSLSARKSMDLHLTRFCRKMEVSDYAYTLSLISISLTDIQHLSPNHLLHFIHLASIMLHEHPTHSLAHIQKFTIRCINVFNENLVFTQGPPELRLQVLEMVSQHCSDQQATLRSIDATGIWLLLFKYLAPSPDHDQSTEVTIFHKIVSIISSLIRLRRDLVAHALPHLGMILRQLILCTRACRPNLGGKQTSVVMNTQPRWINASHPLSGEEAKMLGRLLESLNAKTTVRTFASSSSLTTETQKAESLAKPFSKHAAYVLEAYIEAMNDPLCVLSLEVRKELQPGIFALCEMISEHSRDSLMMSALDAGGKATLKAVWREYDKQSIRIPFGHYSVHVLDGRPFVDVVLFLDLDLNDYRSFKETPNSTSPTNS